jgi:hypothetical protein
MKYSLILPGAINNRKQVVLFIYFLPFLVEEDYHKENWHLVKKKKCKMQILNLFVFEILYKMGHDTMGTNEKL